MRSFLLLGSSGVVVLALACGGKTVGPIGDGGTGTSSGTSSSGSSGTSGSSSGSGGPFASCLETSGSPPACISCIETDCAAPLAALESGCTNLLDCECPGGVFSQAAAETCAPKAQEPSCMATVNAISQCEEQYCSAPCVQSSGGSSGTGGSSSGVSSGGAGSSGGSSGGPTSSCETDPMLTASLCPSPGEQGYQCTPGDDPSEFDPQLTCSTPTPDPDGVHDDYCCTG